MSVVGHYSSSNLLSLSKYRAWWYLISICLVRFPLASLSIVLLDPWLLSLIDSIRKCIHPIENEKILLSQTHSWADEPNQCYYVFAVVVVVFECFLISRTQLPLHMYIISSNWLPVHFVSRSVSVTEFYWTYFMCTWVSENTSMDMIPAIYRKRRLMYVQGDWKGLSMNWDRQRSAKKTSHLVHITNYISPLIIYCKASYLSGSYAVHRFLSGFTLRGIFLRINSSQSATGHSLPRSIGLNPGFSLCSFKWFPKPISNLSFHSPPFKIFRTVFLQWFDCCDVWSN